MNFITKASTIGIIGTVFFSKGHVQNYSLKFNHEDMKYFSIVSCLLVRLSETSLQRIEQYLHVTVKHDMNTNSSHF